jgi:signal transduction histidine kinase
MPLARWMALLALVVPWVVVWPSVTALLGPLRGVEAPVDRSLRVPFGAVFLSGGTAGFRVHDRILEVALPGDGRVVSPRSREQVVEALEGQRSGTVSLRVMRGREVVGVSAERAQGPGWRALAENWPLAFAGPIFLLFGLGILLASRHPIAPPLVAVSWCLGTYLLAQIELILPEDPGVHGIPSLRSGLGVMSLTLLPASVLHLALRFPVVAPRLRSPAVAALGYLLWLFPALLAQLHLDDAVFLSALERIALGAAVLTAGILVVGSWTAVRAMTPIERARSRALGVGLVAGSAFPLLHLVLAWTPPPLLRPPLVLSVLAFPAALAWAIVRYRLLDAPSWLRNAALNGLAVVVSLLVASAMVTLVLSPLGAPLAMTPAELVPIALTTAVLSQGLQFVLRRGAGRRVLRERAYERLLEEASRELAGARSPEGVLAGVVGLIGGHLEASRVLRVPVVRGDPGSSPLARRGLALWRGEGSPRDRIVRASAREEDPGPELAELVLPLFPDSTPGTLVVIGSRADGLPYGEEHERMLGSLRHVATTALEAAATAADLERRVAEKTATLERALSDRQAVLRAARTICEAEHADQVWETIRLFAADRVAAVGMEGGFASASRKLPPRPAAAPGERAGELTPQLETLRAFAHLAVARLDLLTELKREVERQAAEIADITSRRLHAEFVRGVAHELRKPAEEIRQRVEELYRLADAPAARMLERIRAAGREMSRRLDLLLFHSGVRLDRQRIDLVRVVEDALEGVRGVFPDREYRVEHELARLPMLGDPSRLLSVVQNLLDNAAKATRPLQAITVRTSREPGAPQGSPWVRLEVEDQGLGIAPEWVERVFDPGVTLAPNGFGLGLSLCREIVRMHGGTIAVQSRPGRTSFRIRLPQFARGSIEDEGHGVDPARRRP